MKFVILDEVDYMTKNAQNALKHILQTSYTNIRFCLICNYITKIEESLQKEFMCIRFDQLPKLQIVQFMQSICASENLFISDDVLDTIQEMYNSDIRSMVNYIQLNQNIFLKSSQANYCIINNTSLIDIICLLENKEKKET